MPTGLPSLGMPSFSAANILGNIVFSCLGYAAYSYGRKMNSVRVMVQGGALLAYSYVVPDTFWLYAIGLALTGWIWFTRNDA